MHQPTLSKEAFQIATYAAAGASLSSLLAKNHPHITSLGPSYPMIIASLFGACTSIAKTALAALHPLYVRNEGPWNVHASNHIDKALYYTIAVCSLLSHPNTAPSLLNTVEAIRDKAFAFLLLLSTTRCLLALLILSNSTLLVFQRIVGLALIHTIQAAERALGRAPPPPPVLYDILFPLNQRNQSLLPSPPKWPFIDIPKLYPTAQALTLPSQSIDVLTQAAPRIGWETLQQIKGCEHLYQRLKEEVQGVATNKANYYPRLKAYAGHLLTYAKDHPDMAPILYDLFKQTQGRCGGIIQDVENAYYLYCIGRQSKLTTLDQFLETKGWSIRQELFAHCIQDWDVHESSALREKIAKDVGIAPLQEPDRIGRVSEKLALQAKEFILSSYVLKLLCTLHDDLQNPETSQNKELLRLQDHEDQGSRVSHKLFDEMLSFGILPDHFLPVCLEKLKKLRREVQTKQGSAFWQHEFFHTLSNNELKTLTLEDVVDSQNLACKAAILYPALKQLTTKEHLLHFLVKKGLLQPSPLSSS